MGHHVLVNNYCFPHAIAEKYEAIYLNLFIALKMMIMRFSHMNRDIIGLTATQIFATSPEMADSAAKNQVPERTLAHVASICPLGSKEHGHVKYVCNSLDSARRPSAVNSLQGRLAVELVLLEVKFSAALSPWIHRGVCSYQMLNNGKDLGACSKRMLRLRSHPSPHGTACPRQMGTRLIRNPRRKYYRQMIPVRHLTLLFNRYASRTKIVRSWVYMYLRTCILGCVIAALSVSSHNWHSKDTSAISTARRNTTITTLAPSRAQPQCLQDRMPDQC